MARPEQQDATRTENAWRMTPEEIERWLEEGRQQRLQASLGERVQAADKQDAAE